MSGVSGVTEAEEPRALLTKLAHDLHEICQPLTALQCRLEIEQMEREGEVPSDDDRTNRTLADCVRECERMNEHVSTMRMSIRRALDERQEGHQ